MKCLEDDDQLKPSIPQDILRELLHEIHEICWILEGLSLTDGSGKALCLIPFSEASPLFHLWKKEKNLQNLILGFWILNCFFVPSQDLWEQ